MSGWFSIAGHIWPDVLFIVHKKILLSPQMWSYMLFLLHCNGYVIMCPCNTHIYTEARHSVQDWVLILRLHKSLCNCLENMHESPQGTWSTRAFLFLLPLPPPHLPTPTHTPIPTPGVGGWGGHSTMTVHVMDGPTSSWTTEVTILIINLGWCRKDIQV